MDYLYSDSNGIKRVPGEEEWPPEKRHAHGWRRQALANLYRRWHDVSLRPDEPGFELSNN